DDQNIAFLDHRQGAVHCQVVARRRLDSQCCPHESRDGLIQRPDPAVHRVERSDRVADIGKVGCDQSVDYRTRSSAGSLADPRRNHRSVTEVLLHPLTVERRDGCSARPACGQSLTESTRPASASVTTSWRFSLIATFVYRTLEPGEKASTKRPSRSY